jgi:hypothetical protein
MALTPRSPTGKDAITADCPLRAQPGTVWNLCGAFFPDLAAAM